MSRDSPNRTASALHFSHWYHVSDVQDDGKSEPFTIDVAYDRTELSVNETVAATATLKSNLAEAAPMIIVDLPIPAGFVITASDLAEMVWAGTVAKFQVNPRSAVIHLRRLPSGQLLTLRYRLTATMPVKVHVPPTVTYEYYDTDKKAAGRPAQFVVEATER